MPSKPRACIRCLLAIGSERYVPYEGRQRPRELLTQSNALLGQGQLSLAKYLLIVAGEDNPESGCPQRARLLPPRAGTGRLAAGPALPDLHDDRHAGLQWRRIEPRLEGRDRRRRPAAADAARGHRQPPHAARRPRLPPAEGRFAGLLVVRGAGVDGRGGEEGAAIGRSNAFALHSTAATRSTTSRWLWSSINRSSPRGASTTSFG